MGRRNELTQKLWKKMQKLSHGSTRPVWQCQRKWFNTEVEAVEYARQKARYGHDAVYVHRLDVPTRLDLECSGGYYGSPMKAICAERVQAWLVDGKVYGSEEEARKAAEDLADKRGHAEPIWVQTLDQGEFHQYGCGHTADIRKAFGDEA